MTYLALPRIDEDDVFLVATPLSHAPGLGTWAFIARGAKQVVMPFFDPGRVLNLIEREHCTTMLLVPTMIQLILADPDAKRRDCSSLRWVMYGAAPIAEQTLQAAIELWGNILWQGYGQSEASPISYLPPRRHVPGSPWLRSAGRPTPNVLVRIENPDGQELGPEEVGEIVVRTPGAMKEIWNDPDATASRLTPDGWVRTGDLGYTDPDGFLYIIDRKEDMIVSGGFNIWPAEVESALLAHPAVAEAAVIGVPHPKWGETPKAVVVLKPGYQATEDELIAWCRERVGPVRKPTSVEFRTQPLPRSPVGKVLRRVLREPYWGDVARRVSGA